MNVLILVIGLTGLTLAKSLVNKGISVDIFYSKNKSKKDINRTLGISKVNLEFFNKEISNIKLLWDIKKIEIFSNSLDKESILNFENSNETLFSMIKNDALVDFLKFELKKEKLCSFKKNLININILKNYDLIFNCDYSNSITKNFFINR